MHVRRLAIKEDKQSILTLVRVFAGHRCPVHFWRGEWFAWTGTHYEQVGQQGIARRGVRDGGRDQLAKCLRFHRGPAGRVQC